MDYHTDVPWIDDFIQASTVLRGGRATEFYRSARAGRHVRIASGVYLPASVWNALSADERFLASIHAAARASRPGLVFSHFSAAALWRLPIIGSWPSKAEVTVGAEALSPSRHGFTARRYPIPEHPDSIDGLPVTALPRTLTDLGRTAPLSIAVAMMDRALAAKGALTSVHGVQVTRSELVAELLTGTARGRTRCSLAINIADGLSGSAGESLSRVGMHLLGLPMPVLQHRFDDALGLVGITDFWWPQFNLVGEFDGVGKYLREPLLAGQTTAEAVIAEKRREDRIRACGPRVVRWGWDVARSLPALARHLGDAGLR